MKPCPRPIDPLDAEAVAAGAESLCAPDAAAHARQCPACGSRVCEAASLLARLDGLLDDAPVGDLADRVLRLRPFSRLERRRFALWRGPFLFAAALSFAGFVCLALPGISAHEQASLAMAALAPLLAFFAALGRWFTELLSAAPPGLDALSNAFRRGVPSRLALLLLIALVPLCFGLRSVLARASRR